MTKLYAIMPMFSINDPEQCSPDEDKVRNLAKEFLRKHGGPDCPAIALVELEVLDVCEYSDPIWVGPPKS